MRQNLHDAFQKNILWIIVVFFWYAQYVYIPYQTVYLYAAGVAANFIGIIVGVYGLAQLVFRMPVGLIADKINLHKTFILLGVLAAGAASLFRVCLPAGPGFLAGNLLSGFASAMWISFMVLYFSYFTKENRQKASGLIVAANNIGILLGFVTSTVLYGRFGMRLLCGLSVAAAAVAFLLSCFIREPATPKKAPSVRDLVRVCADRRLIVFSILALIQQGIQLSTSMSFTAQVAKQKGADNVQIGLCSIIYILTAVLSSYFAATESARHCGTRFWIPAILICLAAYCVLVPNLPSVEWICAAQVLSGLSTGILFSYCTSEAMVNVPKQKASTAMGFYQAVYAVGMTVFPALTGKIANVSSIGAAFYVLSGIALSGVVLSLLFYRFGKTGRRIDR